jgi:putative ABC transport system permease protein
MGHLLQDFRYAGRVLAKNPGFTALAVSTLAVGIGANTALFSVINALLLRPLPYSQPERLVLISGQKKALSADQSPLSWPRFQLVNEQNRSFTGVAGFVDESFNMTGHGDPEQLSAARVSWNFFQILGVQPAIGRTFALQEDKPGGPPVVLLSDAFWRRKFAANPAAVGRPITLDQKDYTIIGVLPPGFRFDFFAQDIDLVAPRVFELNIATPQQIYGGASFLSFIARLQPGASLSAARAEMDALAAEYRRENPKAPDADPALAVHVGNLRDEMVANSRKAVLILFGAVALVLLIACGNVASLLLSRALGRQREVAVRTAIGATRLSVVRQLLTESLMLALMGGTLGLFLSSWGTRVLTSLAEGNLPRSREIHVDGLVLAFALSISIFGGVLFGLAPAFQISRPDLNSVLRAEGRGATSGRRRHWLRNLLVVSQVTLSTVLLIGAGLLLRNFVQLRAVAGFEPQGLLTMSISLPPARYQKGTQMIAFYRDVVERVRALPGVRSAMADSALPGNPSRFSPALAEGQPAVPLAERPIFNIQTFTPGYVQTLRVPLIRGRDFTEHDGEYDPLVAMVNETTARRYWPNEDPIGKRIWVGRVTEPMRVVGVIGDVRNLNLAADTQPEIYMPFAQRPWAAMNLIVRTERNPRSLAESVRACVLAVDKDQPVTAVKSMDEVLDAASAKPRFTTSLLGALSGTALLLALVGIHGVIAYSVTERTQEMGIRMALGAERADIFRLVLRQGMSLAGAGIVLGIAASLVLTRLLASLLYHVSVTDPLTFGLSAALFLTVAVLASYFPARRATRVDPATALRYD